MLNLQQPRSRSDKYSDVLLEKLEDLFEESMSAAAEELRAKTGSDEVLCALDCSWSKRGHKANFGVMTACSRLTKKVIDSYPMSKYCNVCKGNPNDKCSCNLANRVSLCNLLSAEAEEEQVDPYRLRQHMRREEEDD